jgi:hypothetical protein
LHHHLFRLPATALLLAATEESALNVADASIFTVYVQSASTFVVSFVATDLQAPFVLIVEHTVISCTPRDLSSIDAIEILMFDLH